VIFVYICLMIRKLTLLFVLISLGALLSIACEKDDICLEPATPKLVIRFYDAANPDVLKAVTDLQVVAIGVQDTVKYIAKDSIAIPLDVNNDHCQFKLISSSNPDVINFSYQRENVFISKICGYKTYFHQLEAELQTDSDNWIQQIDIINHSVTIDTSAHVKIFH